MFLVEQCLEVFRTPVVPAAVKRGLYVQIALQHPPGQPEIRAVEESVNERGCPENHLEQQLFCRLSFHWSSFNCCGHLQPNSLQAPNVPSCFKVRLTMFPRFMPRSPLSCVAIQSSAFRCSKINARAAARVSKVTRARSPSIE